MNKVINRVKQIGLIFLSVLLVTGLTACGIGNKWVFSINGEKLSYKDITAVGLIFAKEYNLADASLLQEKYEGSETYGDYYKKQFEEEILKTLLFYNEAKANGIKLSKEESRRVEDYAENLVEDFGRDYLKEKKITRSDFEKIYEMRLLGDSYIKDISKDDTGSEKDSEDTLRYIKVFQVLFPTVELDDNGMVQSDQDGKTRKLSEAEIEEKKNAALEFHQKVQDGGDMEALLQGYDRAVTGMEQYLKYSDLSVEYKKEIDALSEGDISDVITADYGYCVVKLLESDAKEYGKMLSSDEEMEAQRSKAEEERDRLYGIYIENNKKYMNQKRWEQIEMEQYIKE